MTRPDLRTAHARRTRAAIRAAALCLTRERGYVAMTVDDVAALAGVSRRTVFNHFSSKADLIVVGLEPPEPDDVEAFVSGTGTLLEDLGSLLASSAESVEPERDWLLACPEVVRDNPEVERAVARALGRVRGDYTTVVVTHRPATVAVADTVVVMEDGRVAEAGPREELEASGGLLAHFMEEWRDAAAWRV